MTVSTYKATGEISWPICVAAGGPGVGKTFFGLEASASDLIAATYYIPFDERIPNDYRSEDGFKFDIVRHDGTVRDVLAQIDAINAETAGGPPTLMIIDCSSRMWSTMAEEVQDRADARPKRGTRSDDTRDLWVDAAREWASGMERLRAHNGPVLLTARVDERDGKIEGHKTLLHDADVVIEMPERGEYIIRKVDSALYRHTGRLSTNSLRLEDIWRDMGLSGAETGGRAFVRGRAEATTRTEDTSGRDWDFELETAAGDTRKLAQLGVDARSANAAPDIRNRIRDAHTAASRTKPVGKPAAGVTTHEGD